MALKNEEMYVNRKAMNSIRNALITEGFEDDNRQTRGNNIRLSVAQHITTMKGSALTIWN